MPVWQREWPGLKTPGARFITVAQDPEIAVARPFAENLDFTTLVDTAGRLPAILGFRIVPDGFLFGADGTLLDEIIFGLDLLRDQAATRDLVKSWLGLGPAPERHVKRAGVNTSVPAALELFAEGQGFLARGERERALARWHKAFLADPESLVVRKQIWRMLYPERFGDVIDREWQNGQMAREKELGFGTANPGLPPPA